MQTHPWMTVAIIAYLIVNIVPRPDVDSLTGYKKLVWQVLDRIAFLTSDKLPGRFKMLLTATSITKASVPVRKTRPVETSPEQQEKQSDEQSE